MNINNYIYTRLYKQLNTSRNQAFFYYLHASTVYFTRVLHVHDRCVLCITYIEQHLLAKDTQ